MNDASPGRIVLRSMLQPFRFERDEHVYLGLLAKLALLGCLYPLLDEVRVGDWVWTVSLWIVMLGAIDVCAESRRQRRLAVWLFAGGFVTKVLIELLKLTHLPEDHGLWVWLMVAVAAIYIAFFALVGRVILVDVFRTGRVTTNRILGSICLYVLIGIGFAYAFAIVELFSADDAFRLGEASLRGPTMLSQLLYFSFTSLTTLGYGDIVPRLDVARLLATLEAMVGQIYLTVLVARLVGLHISQGGDPRG